MIENIIVGVSTGVLSSILAWLFLYNFMAPKIKFAKKLKKEKTKNNKTGYYYQFKFGNFKKRIAAVDLAIRATLYLPEFPSPGVTNMYSIPTAKSIFELTPKNGANTGWCRRFSFSLNTDEFINNFDKTYFSDDFKALAHKKMLCIEHLLTITPNAFIRIHVSAMDALSGARKVFRSKDYRLDDVIEGKFERSSLELIPYDGRNAEQSAQPDLQ